MRKITPYNIVKGIRYLQHFGPKEFWARLRERMEPEEVPYGPWYEHYVPSQDELEKQKRRRFALTPVFSVIVPCYRTPARFAAEMIESVREQTYPHWELILVNASTEYPETGDVLSAYAGKDRRIRVITLSGNEGIAGNTQKGLDAATGDFIALLDHDDTLSPCALYQLALHLEKHPDRGVIYTDEDKIRDAEHKNGMASGTQIEHFQPHLKPDYAPDLLRSNNYICHFLAVRRDVAQQAGGFRPGYDGAQDHDFIFRCIFKAQEMGLQVGHVPEILYHWRVHASSTADNPMSKTYAAEAGKRAIEAELERRGEKGTVSLRKEMGFYRVTYPVTGDPLVSILIPNKDQKETLRQCLDTLIKTAGNVRYEILVIENNSTTDEIFDYYRQIDGKKGIRVLYWEGPFNYSAINNFGFAHAKGDYILCLNNDIRCMETGWLAEMLGTCQRPHVAMVGAKLLYPDDTVQHAGIVIGIGGIAGSMFVNLKKGYTGYLHKADLM